MKQKTIFDLFPAMRNLRRLVADMTLDDGVDRETQVTEMSLQLTADVEAMGITVRRAWLIFDAYETPKILSRIETLDSNLRGSLQFSEWQDEALIAMESERGNLCRQIGLL